MRLAIRELGGDGPPLVVLHGLYGSSRNWTTAGKLLAARFRVLAFDLRNHGDSPHAPGMSYPTLAADLLETIDDVIATPVTLLGHSLGGKTAMRAACDAPARVAHLLVADIAPKQYAVDPTPVEAMLAASLEGATRRAEIDQQLAERLDDPSLRQFLLTNLERNAAGFAWRIDLRAIRDDLPELGRSPVGPSDRYDGPVDFFYGGRSPYVSPSDLESARRTFPRARGHVLPDSGHDVHVDARDAFVAAVLAATADPS
jgi:pimeloyl-ACP methyl ester carboxylesterase